MKKSYLYSFGKRISSTSFGGFFHFLFLRIYITLNFYWLYVLRLTLINNLYVLPQSNHVIIFTLIKIIFMLQRLSWSLEAQAMKFHDLETYPSTCYLECKVHIVAIISLYLFHWGFKRVDYFKFGCYSYIFICGSQIYATSFRLFFFSYLVHHLFYWDF